MAAMRRGSLKNPAGGGTLVPLALALLIGSAGTASADVGFGIGFGFQNNAYTESNFLNSWSLQNAASAAANRPGPLTAPRFPVRDEGIMDRYDLATREAMVNRIARNPSAEMSSVNPGGVRRPATTASRPAPPPSTPRTNPAPPPPTAPEPRPVVLLGNFFDRERRLAWPTIAPITGDLGKKQEIADRAVLAVLNEYDLQGLSRLSNVTEARERLLEYGRPALDFVRNQSTPALADSFHVFLLSLYSNLGLAATVTRVP